MTTPLTSGTSKAFSFDQFPLPDDNLFRRLSSLENEPITGEMRVQVTFEQYKVRLYVIFAAG